MRRKSKAKREAKLAETSHVASVDAKNYGTCESQKRKPSRNGHMVHAEETIPLTYGQIDEIPDVSLFVLKGVFKLNEIRIETFQNSFDKTKLFLAKFKKSLLTKFV